MSDSHPVASFPQELIITVGDSVLGPVRLPTLAGDCKQAQGRGTLFVSSAKFRLITGQDNSRINVIFWGDL